MKHRHRHDKRIFPRAGANRRMGIGLSNAAEYWPLTIVPSTSRPRRSISAWLIIGGLALLGGALALAVQRGIPAW
jgi:hypothetical protein